MKVSIGRLLTWISGGTQKVRQMLPVKQQLAFEIRWPTRTNYGVVNRAWPTGRHIGRGISQRVRELPACLKEGMEAVSGVNLERVRVHYNSRKPAEVYAHAYAQGLDIHLAPGQEHHLPHELGHVVQQKLGMVQPTRKVNGMAVNDDVGLELHATELGEMAVRVGGCVGYG